MFSPDLLLKRAILVIVPLLLSVTVHEFAHAWAAFRLGDDTAARQGRLTLNPFAHADLFGTFLVPLLSPIPFGWAKPVPFVARNFRRDVHMGTGTMLVAIAGPISNVILAVLCAVLFAGMARFAPATMQPGMGPGELVLTMLELNVVLALFNLIPVPPLDGSRIVDWLMPTRLRPAWEGVMRISPFLFLGVLFFGGRLIAGPERIFLNQLFRLVAALS